MMTRLVWGMARVAPIQNKSKPTSQFFFPKEFCIRQNAKHWSNEQETLKLIDTIIKR